MVICLWFVFQLKLLYTKKGVERTPSGQLKKCLNHLTLRSAGLEVFLRGAGASIFAGSGAGAGFGCGSSEMSELENKSVNLLIRPNGTL